MRRKKRKERGRSGNGDAQSSPSCLLLGDDVRPETGTSPLNALHLGERGGEATVTKAWGPGVGKQDLQAWSTSLSAQECTVKH